MPCRTITTTLTITLIVLFGGLSLGFTDTAVEQSIDLAGQWRFQLDRTGAGLEEEWFRRDLDQVIHLPGILQAQGYGDPISVDTKWVGSLNDRSFYDKPLYAEYRQPNQFMVPFFLQPPRHYVGIAWYQRNVEIPVSFSGRQNILELERCHWITSAWMDDQPLGSCDSLSTPHRYALPAGLEPGHHRLTICVDNGVKIGVGPNAHSVTDHTQTNWNGLIGELRIVSHGALRINQMTIVPHVEARTVTARIVISALQAGPHSGTLQLDAVPHAVAQNHPVAQEYPFQFSGHQHELEVDYAIGSNAVLWDEFTPAVYQLHATLSGRGVAEAMDNAVQPIPLRHVSTDKTQINLNGRPLFLRGALECNIFPLTGHPPCDVDSWRKVFETAKLYGLNHIRFHSHCPPEAAFVAADEVGIYLQVEVATWVNQGPQLGQGDCIDRWIYDETDRILSEYGNHPSFVMLASGNEPGGADVVPFLAKYVEHYKSDDGRRLVTSASGWPRLPSTDFQVFPNPRLQQWGEGVDSRINATPPATTADFRDWVARVNQPIVSHEIGQWVVFPNLTEISKYVGYLEPTNLKVFADLLRRKDLLDQAQDFLMASGKLQLLCYKEEIETALRTPGFGGFQLLGLQDFPGQGSALVGVVDPFWDSKPYCSPKEYREFCNATVPLARLPRRITTADTPIKCSLEVAHFGPSDLSQTKLHWRVTTSSGSVVVEGTLPPRSVPTGKLTKLGDIGIDCSSLKAKAAKLTLVVDLEAAELSGPHTNRWDLWVYPTAPSTEFRDDIVVIRRLGEETRRHLEAGKKVVVLPDRDTVKTDLVTAFSPIFWSSSWTNQSPPHTLGLLCDPSHPLFKHFPTDSHTNWQWWELVSTAAPLELDGLPLLSKPLVQIVPDYFDPRLLAMVFEARVGAGRVIVCSADIESDLEKRLAARQFRASLIAYVQSNAFNPYDELSYEQLKSLFRE